jgi:hypothetical protein
LGQPISQGHEIPGEGAELAYRNFVAAFRDRHPMAIAANVDTGCVQVHVL